MAEVVSLAPQPWPQRRFCRSGSGSPASGPSNGGGGGDGGSTHPPAGEPSARTRAARRSSIIYISAAPFPRTRSQNVRLKNLSFLAKSKIGIFACFFVQT
jgi:hypothetical protein